MTITPEPEYLPQTTDAVDIARVAESPGQMLALAIINKTAPETLAKLMDLHERWAKAKARTAYVEAMAAFKKEAPAVIVKASKVDFSTSRGRTNYNYANLGDIVQQITAMLSRHSLSVSWETGNADPQRGITVTCHVTHSEGHRESVTLSAPADESGNKNKIQAVGSTVTYLQRYTLMAALGLATADMDDDGQSAGIRPGVVEDAKTEGTESHPPKKTATPKQEPTDKWDAWKGTVLSRIATARESADPNAASESLKKLKAWLTSQKVPEKRLDIMEEIKQALAEADNALAIDGQFGNGNGDEPPEDMWLKALLDMLKDCHTLERHAELCQRWEQDVEQMDAGVHQEGTKILAEHKAKLGG